MNSVYDQFMVIDGARPRSRDADWPKLFAVSLCRFDAAGNREILATFSTADPNPDRIANHWIDQVRRNWHVNAGVMPLFEDDPAWRAIVVQKIFEDEQRVIVVHPRHRVDDVLSRLSFELELAAILRQNK
ncbi:hypothetical protein [Nocardia fluminea]|uniref:hypothetical protein n=1 Tax=Nocardia fluminea TaxID=134984 RepID=UPI0033ECDB15